MIILMLILALRKWLHSRTRSVSLLILVLLGASLGEKSFGQVKLTDLSISTESTPNARYKGPGNGLKTNTTTSQQRMALSANFSLANRFDSSTGRIHSWTASVNSVYSTLSNKGYERQLFPSRLMSTEVGVRYYRSLQKRWGMVSLLSAGLYSDLHHVDGNDIFVNAGVIFIKHYSPRFSLGFGGIATNSVGAPMVFPVVTVQWETAGKFKILLNNPDNEPGVIYKAGIGYAVNKSTEWQLSVRYRRSVFDVDPVLHKDNQRLMSAWEKPIGLDYIRKMKQASITIGAGMMPARNYEFGKKEFSAIFKSNTKYRLDATYYLRATLQWKW